MSENHPLVKAYNSGKPYVRISYYDYHEWLQCFDANKFSTWETLRFKAMHEKYFWGRFFLGIPLLGASWGAAHVVLGPTMIRRDAGFRENILFATFFYILFNHWLDSRAVPCRYLDELLTQQSPNGDYIRDSTRDHMPDLWEDFEKQLLAKGVGVKVRSHHPRYSLGLTEDVNASVKMNAA
jgi:hypothetical protein